MKYEFKPSSPVPFMPITISMTIENDEELRELYHRLGMDFNIVTKHTDLSSCRMPESPALPIGLWEEIYNYMESNKMLNN